MSALSPIMTAGGLLLLFVGGEVLLRGAVALALRSGASPLLIGLTVVAFATSLPELMVTVTAGLEGVPDVGVGNVVGSNIANVLLILGVAAVISPIATQPRQIMRDAIAMIAATGVFVAFALLGNMTPWHGITMLGLLLFYLVLSYALEQRQNRRAAKDAATLEEAGKASYSLPVALLLVAAGIGALVAGSELLVTGATDLARWFGISETVIGLTLVAIGTSLPELATAIVAGIRGHTEVALGNVLGSNIFNLLLIIGCLTLLTPVQVSAEIISLDMWVMAAVALLVVPVMFTGHRICRVEGAGFLVIYVVYIVYRFYPGVT